jgi:voltage-gated potassium channel
MRGDSSRQRLTLAVAGASGAAAAVPAPPPNTCCLICPVGLPFADGQARSHARTGVLNRCLLRAVPPSGASPSLPVAAGCSLVGAPRTRGPRSPLPFSITRNGGALPDWMTARGSAADASKSHGVDERSREVERRLEPPLFVFALLTIPAIAIEYGPAGQPWSAIGSALNWTIWLAFVAEVVIMLSVVPNRGLWLREHPLDLVIVIFTPPFLPPAWQTARVLRLLRLLRLVKAGGLARRVFSTEGVRDAAVLTLIAVLGGGAAFASFEKDQHLSAWDGIWWAITTVTTVGYGTPEVTTDGGRIVGICLMATGIGAVAVLTAAAAERFVHSRREEERAVEARLDEIIRRLDRLDAKKGSDT